MKRTIQGLLVTSLLLIGCADSAVDPLATQEKEASPEASRELVEIRDNLTGICGAIEHYGLPVRADVREYVRRQIERISAAATEVAEADPSIRQAATADIEQLASSFESCYPAFSREFSDALEALESS
ncbi:MAG: hypothetical protein J0H66_04370 [Solirubrobacterales bacterium]|nr:hypothetical protein [Solirubrobacterales bacterium]OJU96307.1 MAG: hypothetical protein BGO23_02030 [Solirubrobacterales bacterium 67-14]